MTNSLRNLTLVFALALAACPVLVADPLLSNPKVVAFSASSTEVTSGASVTLTWATADATAISIERAGHGEVAAPLDAEGSREIVVTEPSLFVLNARNARGATDTAMVLVRLMGSAADATLTALPSTITSGQASTLAWSAQGATEVTLTAVPGGAIDVGSQLAYGSVSVAPTQTTSYLLTAGTRSAMTTVTVAPIASELRAIPSSVAPGGTVRIEWATSGATAAQLTLAGSGVVADVTDPGMVASGHYDFTAPATVDGSALFEFELTASGDGSPSKRRLVVPVTGTPFIDAFTLPAAVRGVADAGAMDVSWTTVGAEVVSLERDGVELYRTTSSAQAVSGTVSIASPSADTQYTLKAFASRGGEASTSRRVEVRGLPMVTLMPSVGTVTAGTPFSLSWMGRFIHGATITDSKGNLLLSKADGAGDTGLVERLAINSDTTYRIEVHNGLGDRASAVAGVAATGTKRLTQVETGALQQGQLAHVSFSLNDAPLLGVPSRGPVRFVTNFDDISGLGTPLVFESHDSFAQIHTDFRAPFFGQIVGARINVSVNGYLTFSDSMNPNNVDSNPLNVVIPTSQLEPMSIAPYWTDLLLDNGQVEWLVKPAGSGQVLIVQWTDLHKIAAPGVHLKFQVKFFSTGQIDLEYHTTNSIGGKAGVQGPRGTEGLDYPMRSPVQNSGLTFMEPQSSPALFPVLHEEPLTFFYESGGALAPIEHDPGVVLQPTDLHFAEAMVSPDVRVGRDGAWFELRNTSDRAIDLQGWSLRAARDGGAFGLTGSVPARGSLVIGTNDDSALNDDAGVTLELPVDFDFTRDGGGGVALGRVGATSYDFARDGGGGVTISTTSPMTSFDWSSTLLTPGTTVVEDFGPFRSDTTPTATPSQPARCGATVGYGSLFPRQRGSPGLDQFCSLPYEWRETSSGFFDISATGQQVPLSDPNTGYGLVSLTAAPVPFLGVPRTAARVSSNGFLTFDLVSASNVDFAYPLRPTEVTMVLAVFGDDLAARRPDSAVYVQRVGAGVDPFASAPHWIVQWSHWSSVQAITPDDLNFQVKLFDDGVLEYQYGPLRPGADVAAHASGRFATVMVAPTGANTLMINFQRAVLSAKAAYRISPR